MTEPVSVYRIFRHGHGEADSVRTVVIALVLFAVLLTGTAIIRVGNQHEVLRLGYTLSKRSDEVRHLRERKRQLELERATLTAPDRIRNLATRLGMTQVAPDHIRVIRRHEVATLMADERVQEGGARLGEEAGKQ